MTSWLCRELVKFTLKRTFTQYSPRMMRKIFSKPDYHIQRSIKRSLRPVSKHKRRKIKCFLWVQVASCPSTRTSRLLTINSTSLNKNSYRIISTLKLPWTFVALFQLIISHLHRSNLMDLRQVTASLHNLVLLNSEPLPNFNKTSYFKTSATLLIHNIKRWVIAHIRLRNHPSTRARTSTWTTQPSKKKWHS